MQEVEGNGTGKRKTTAAFQEIHLPVLGAVSLLVFHTPCHQPPATDRMIVCEMSSPLALKAHPGMPLLVLRKRCSCKKLETKNIV